MKIKTLHLKDVILIEPKVNYDSRGYFMENFRFDKLNNYVQTNNFVQDNIVKSIKNVIRGLHYQSEKPQGKLIQVLKGEIFDVAVDIRKKSKTYGQWVSEILSDENKKQLYIPEGYAHGYCVLSEESTVLYKCTQYYIQENQRGIIWNDSTINIQWPINKPILSDKDKILPEFKYILEDAIK